MKDINKINYIDDLSGEYTKEIQLVSTLGELRTHVSNWKPLALDAFNRVNEMDEVRFKSWLTARGLEKKGVFSNNEDFMIINMPEVMMKISMIANYFKAPEGLAFIRMRELNKLKIKDGIVVEVYT
jgi:hypothetical protein